MYHSWSHDTCIYTCTSTGHQTSHRYSLYTVAHNSYRDITGVPSSTTSCLYSIYLYHIHVHVPLLIVHHTPCDVHFVLSTVAHVHWGTCTMYMYIMHTRTFKCTCWLYICMYIHTCTCATVNTLTLPTLVHTHVHVYDHTCTYIFTNGTQVLWVWPSPMLCQWLACCLEWWPPSLRLRSRWWVWRGPCSTSLRLPPRGTLEQMRYISVCVQININLHTCTWKMCIAQ